jgi:hypothetical protein
LHDEDDSAHQEMDARLSQIADANELVRALALSRVDQRLLQDVRKITTDHESRRGAILHELQGLATRIGAFPVARQPTSGVEYAEPVPRPITAANSVPEANAIPTANGVAGANDHVRPFSRGDWRQAASNIEDGLDDLFKQRRVAVMPLNSLGR